MGTKNNQYRAEFKRDVVNYYYSSGTSIKATAEDLKVSPSSLNDWIQSVKKNDGTVCHWGSVNYSSDAGKEITNLKKEFRYNEDALEILKKAIGTRVYLKIKFNFSFVL